ncbi:hypothetical protein IMZ48_40325 [Candidatus Bathyarchaeota archaeon]|nr:hypothetical protein [Candidatus Bathyarchaeota archaeon]
MRLKAAVVGAILSPVGVDAFWRMECPHRLGLGRVDPMTNFGTVSQHAHAIYGSNGKSIFSSPFSEVASLRTSSRLLMSID